MQQAVGQGTTDPNEDFNPFARNAVSAPPRPLTQVNEMYLFTPRRSHTKKNSQKCKNIFDV